jgi:ketosteroid isomerase-like protein
MIDRAAGQRFADEWIAAWNSHDLDRILTHYADDFEFTSPVIVEVMGEPSGTLRGKPAIRTYWSKALARVPELRFTLTEVMCGIRSVVINYVRHDGRHASEWFELDANGVVVRSAAHY